MNVQELDAFELSDTYRETIKKLTDIGEAIKPTSQEGRDLHSLRTACLIELSRRGLR